MPELEEVKDGDGKLIGTNVKPTADEVAADDARKAANAAMATKDRLARIEDVLGI